jgi:hypothetical protein
MHQVILHGTRGFDFEDFVKKRAIVKNFRRYFADKREVTLEELRRDIGVDSLHISPFIAFFTEGSIILSTIGAANHLHVSKRVFCLLTCFITRTLYDTTSKQRRISKWPNY